MNVIYSSTYLEGSCRRNLENSRMGYNGLNSYIYWAYMGPIQSHRFVQ